MFSSISSVLLLAFGFGFVIFFHELGHFLAAKWAGVKVEQFAVGFGHALIAWRKGLGFRWGSTQTDYQEKLFRYITEHHDEEILSRESTPEPSATQMARASEALGISETEYRLNWIPLGGYVKMLGQDDLKPGASVEDPRAYNNKSIGKRMVIVSAGVIMNVILAFVGFMIIFRIGFKVPPAVVGMVQPGSPAQRAYKIDGDKRVVVGLAVGDRILYLNDKYQSDFEKIQLNTALLSEAAPIPVYVRHTDGSTDHLMVFPTKPPEGGDLLRIGIGPAYELRGVDVETDVPFDPKLNMPSLHQIKKGDVITAIGGEPVLPTEFWKLDQAMQKSRGHKVDITVKDANGVVRNEQVQPHFEDRFGQEPVNFAGMLMRPQVQSISPDSNAANIIQPGDIVVAFTPPTTDANEQTPEPTRDQFMRVLNDLGQHGGSLNITVLRGDKLVDLKNIRPAMRISPERYGLGIGLGMDEDHPVLAGTAENSPARAAGIPAGAVITAINGQPVHSWFDVNTILSELTPDQAPTLTATVDGKEKQFIFEKFTPEQIAAIGQNRYTEDLLLQPAIDTRKTTNLMTAAAWGVGETRDAILQVYQTVRAMLGRSISVKQVSGPVGILAVGYKFAEMGLPRLIWFLSIISANLAVMNFLPIPIVDGGLFTFLIIEKIKGGPISPRIQSIAQVVGLAILLSVFLFATYQDIFNRLPFLNH